MLRVSLLGNLGADPELRHSQKGAAMVTFRVAVNQVRTGADGERQEQTEWFRVRVMGRLADSAQRLTKGARVLVEGRLDISHFQARDGESRVGFEVWADEVVNVSGRPGGDDTEPVAMGARGTAEALEPVGAVGGAPPTNGRARRSAPAEDLEDLPF
jgi:single-strand DNA-binding protein